MNNAEQNQLKSQLLKEIKDYIFTVWGKNDKVSGVQVDEAKTFSDNLSPVFYEKAEYGVTADSERAQMPHCYGVLWSVEDLKVDIGQNLSDAGEVTLFSRTYCNGGEESMHVTEKLEEAVKVVDAVTIGFTEKINAGYETSVTVGVELAPIKAETTSKFSMGIELGASQSSTKTTEKTTTAGFSMDFDVAKGKKKTVTITASKKVGRALNNANFVASGKAYVKVAYGKETLGENTHIYIIDLAAIRKEENSQFDFTYPVQYVVEGVEHTDYNVEISEVEIAQEKALVKSVMASPVISYPLEVASNYITKE